MSLVSLLLAVHVGAKGIITSFSDKKLEKAKELGAKYGINYKTYPDWEEEALRLTAGNGAGIVVDKRGPETLLQSTALLRRRDLSPRLAF